MHLCGPDTCSPRLWCPYFLPSMCDSCLLSLKLACYPLHSLLTQARPRLQMLTNLLHFPGPCRHPKKRCSHLLNLTHANHSQAPTRCSHLLNLNHANHSQAPTRCSHLLNLTHTNHSQAPKKKVLTLAQPYPHKSLAGTHKACSSGSTVALVCPSTTASSPTSAPQLPNLSGTDPQQPVLQRQNLCSMAVYLASAAPLVPLQLQVCVHVFVNVCSDSLVRPSLLVNWGIGGQ